jgi:hypothetical protein
MDNAGYTNLQSHVNYNASKQILALNAFVTQLHKSCSCYGVLDVFLCQLSVFLTIEVIGLDRWGLNPTYSGDISHNIATRKLEKVGERALRNFRLLLRVLITFTRTLEDVQNKRFIIHWGEATSLFVKTRWKPTRIPELKIKLPTVSPKPVNGSIRHVTKESDKGKKKKIFRVSHKPASLMYSHVL